MAEAPTNGATAEQVKAALANLSFVGMMFSGPDSSEMGYVVTNATLAQGFVAVCELEAAAADMRRGDVPAFPASVEEAMGLGFSDVAFCGTVFDSRGTSGCVVVVKNLGAGQVGAAAKYLQAIVTRMLNEEWMREHRRQVEEEREAEMLMRALGAPPA